MASWKTHCQADQRSLLRKATLTDKEFVFPRHPRALFQKQPHTGCDLIPLPETIKNQIIVVFFMSGVQIVVQRCLEASIDTGSIERGLVVYISFGQETSDESIVKAAKGILNLPLSTQGEWGDQFKKESVLNVSREIPQGILVVPQACLTSTIKGKTIKYHKQMDIENGFRVYCEFLAHLETQAVQMLMERMFKEYIPPLSLDDTVYSTFDKRGVPLSRDGETLSKSELKRCDSHYKNLQKSNLEWHEIRLNRWINGDSDHSLFTPIKIIAGTFGEKQGLKVDCGLGPSTHILGF